MCDEVVLIVALLVLVIVVVMLIVVLVLVIVVVMLVVVLVLVIVVNVVVIFPTLQQALITVVRCGCSSGEGRSNPIVLLGNRPPLCEGD